MTLETLQSRYGELDFSLVIAPTIGETPDGMPGLGHIFSGTFIMFCFPIAFVILLEGFISAKVCGAV